MSALDQLEKRWLRAGARDEFEYQTFLARRAAGEPVHRILGWREFWGLRFFLSPETLEPRPDSETVMEVLLSSRKPCHSAAKAGYSGSHDEKESKPSWEPGSWAANAASARDDIRFLDIGTGTGCLLLAALHEFPNATGVGIDLSAGAVVTAQENAVQLNLSDRAAFYELSYEDHKVLKSLGPFDVILCNPPYIPSGEIGDLQKEVKDYDPLAALDGGADGLGPYRILAPQLAGLLNPNGIALFEIGHDQAAAVQEIMTEQNLTASTPYRDLGGNDRVIVVKKT